MKKSSLQVYSFDVFDTCLARVSGKPENIFYLLAEEVLREDDESLVRAFITERKAAERKAMAGLNKEAVTLDEIYAFFDISIFTDKLAEQVKNREMELEMQSYVPICDTVKKIESLRKKGKIIFISDMYLPYELIYNALTTYGIMKTGDTLYISGCIGLSKSSGNLFDYVRSKEGFRENNGFIKQWIHYGDNYYSDYLIPRVKGIKARWIDTRNSVYEAYMEEESRFTTFPIIGSVFSGLMRGARLNSQVDDGSFVSNIMMPLIIPFVVSLLQDAVSRRVKRLYFASRDTYIMYLIAKEFHSLGNGLEIHYLHISRRVLYPTFIQDASKDEIRYILNLIGRFSSRSILELFSYSDDEILNIGHFLDIDKELSVKDMRTDYLIEKMLENGYTEKLKERCSEKRKILREYFYQQGFCNNDDLTVGFVDVGWRCTCQEMIRKIVENPVIFYYWGVYPDRTSIYKTGTFTTFSYWEDLKEFRRGNKFIEFYMFRAPEGSTLGYEQKDNIISPILSDISEKKGIEDVLANNETLLKISRWYLQYPCLLKNALPLFKGLSLKVMANFIQCPNKKAISFLSDKIEWENHYGLSMPIIVKLYPWTAVHLLLSYSLKSINKKVFHYYYVWIDASLIYTYGRFGKQIVLLKQKLLFSTRLKKTVKKLFLIKHFNI